MIGIYTLEMSTILILNGGGCGVLVLVSACPSFAGAEVIFHVEDILLDFFQFNKTKNQHFKSGIST